MFTIYTDTVLSLEAAKKYADLTDADLAALHANAITDKFARYCGRSGWLRGVATDDIYPSVVDLHRGNGEASLYLRGGPVTYDDDNDVTVEILSGGSVSTTLTASAGELYLQDDGQNDGVSVLVRASGVFEVCDGPFNVRATYAGGFATVPADVVQLAIEQLRYDARRMKGEAGAENVSRGGQSASVEKSGLLQSVRDGLSRYRVL